MSECWCPVYTLGLNGSVYRQPVQGKDSMDALTIIFAAIILSVGGLSSCVALAFGWGQFSYLIFAGVFLLICLLL